MAPRLLEAQLSPDRVSFMVGGKESSIMASARVPVPIRTTEDLNSFRIAMRQFDTAAEKCGLDPGMREVLRRPRRALSLSLPVKMDDGTIHVFDGFRVRSEEHTSELQSLTNLVCRLLLEKKKQKATTQQ